VDRTALRYLTTHPGLTGLELSAIEPLYSPRNFDVHADTFFADVLSLHAPTLRRLSIYPRRSGRWALLGQHNARAILQCRALTSLSMSLN
ncbi:hypothetical protein DFH09DRAFT_883020, partial [Mycena vulgaris]